MKNVIIINLNKLEKNYKIRKAANNNTKNEKKSQKHMYFY